MKRTYSSFYEIKRIKIKHDTFLLAGVLLHETAWFRYPRTKSIKIYRNEGDRNGNWDWFNVETGERISEAVLLPAIHAARGEKLLAMKEGIVYDTW